MQPFEANNQPNDTGSVGPSDVSPGPSPAKPEDTTDRNTGTHPLLGSTSPPALQPFKRPITVTHDTESRPDSDPAAASAAPAVAETANASGQAETPERVDEAPAEDEPAHAPYNAAPAPTADETPAAAPTPGVVYGNFGEQPPSGTDKKKRFWKRPAVIGGVLAVLLLAGGGYVFGYYIPNKPENVFKTGLSRTGIAADKLTTAGMAKDKLTTMKNIDFSGNLSVEGPGVKQSGSFSTRYSDTTSDTTVTYNPGGGVKSLSAQALTQLDKGQKYPDIYFRLTGFADLGLDQFVPGIGQYDNKWINISPAYLQSIIPAQDTTPQPKDVPTFTPDDGAALTKVVVDTTRQYVFTNDPDKAVLINKGFKGTETIEDNIAANRYTVSINKAHAKDYCKALITNVTNAPAFKDIPGVPTGTDLATDRDDAITSCRQNIDKNIKDSDTFDMWVGRKSKLINKIRVTDDKDSTTYADFGQTYTSGSKLPLFATFHSGKDKYDAKLKLNVDMDTSTTDGSLAANFDEEGQKWTVDAGFSFKPDSKDITITKPKDAIPVQQVLQAIGLDPSMFTDTGSGSPATGSTYDGIQAKAKDTERQTDISALQAQLEADYAMDGVYPTLAQLNNPAWRTTNMQGLDDQALADPDGGITALASAASKTQYGYAVSGCDATGCQTYTLTAMLSTGSVYSKGSFNYSSEL